MLSPRARTKTLGPLGRRILSAALALGLIAVCLVWPGTRPAQAQVVTTPPIVISQIYTRGGEPGATFQNDYIELFNRSSSPVDINGWTVQVVNTSGGSTGSVSIGFVSSRSVIVEPGRFLLIKFAGGGTAGAPFPVAEDANVQFFSLGTSGRAAIVRNSEPILVTSCPAGPDPLVVDLVGWGTSSCFEGSGAALAPTATAAAIRAGGGCTDTNNNVADFQLGAPAPRSSASPASPCNSTPSSSTIEFSSAQFEVTEGTDRATILVTRTGDTSAPATVDYIVGDQTASERSDYTTTLGTLRFAAGETTKGFRVLITDDSLVEGDETAGMVLANVTGGATLGTRAGAQLVIHDNDFTPDAPNPVDSTSFFVQQHYHDFFSRPVDPAGFSFWTENINSCGADAQCREVKRRDTSAAFFLSIEFQGTGFYVYRLYKAALPERDFRPRALPRYQEFIRDSQEVGRDIIVGNAGWEQQLENNKNAFAAGFVARPEFVANYPLTLSPSEFVDKLNAQAGGVLSQSERDALVAGLTGGSETRASVLRRVVEDEDFVRAELNRAFVLMQYFGYLRRNPNDAPDNSFSGFDFWLGKLNEHGGDFRRAEMVKSFIISGEYRRRFGTR